MACSGRNTIPGGVTPDSGDFSAHRKKRRVMKFYKQFVRLKNIKVAHFPRKRGNATSIRRRNSLRLSSAHHPDKLLHTKTAEYIEHLTDSRLTLMNMIFGTFRYARGARLHALNVCLSSSIFGSCEH